MRTEAGARWSARYVVMVTGQLSTTKNPTLPGQELFTGLSAPANRQSALEVGSDERTAHDEQSWTLAGFGFALAYYDLLRDQRANDTAAGFIRNKIAGAVQDPLARSYDNGDEVPGKPLVFMPYVGGVRGYRRILETVVADGHDGYTLRWAGADL